MKQKNNAARLGAAVLAGLCLTAGAAMASAGGSQADPLVTLSYLTQTVTPTILNQIDQQAALREQELTDALNSAIQSYSGRIEAALGGAGGDQEAGTYTVVTLYSGQVLHMEIGCEVMLRIGTASCATPYAPGLIDTTSGGTLNDGGALAVNHLYMATIEGRSVRATAEVVKVLVRGGYTIT